MAEESEHVDITVGFIGAEDVPILYGNQFVVQFLQDEFIITIGQMAPPILLGSPEQQMEQAKKVSFVPIRVVARLAFNRTRFEELTQLMQQQMARFDEEKRKGGT
jgi:hypothetical protein